ncbi:MAG: DUF1573 domain-containing protein [Anaerolineales bacterium]|nr:MAG: DUF1573 domain-containing protein [Anaerolineales bacterium]
MKSNKIVLLVIGVIVALGVSFAVGYFALGQGAKREVSFASSLPTTAPASSPAAATPAQAEASQLAQTTVTAEEMFSEFICPCCGKPIGECTCDMAAERRGFVSGLASAGKNQLEIYLAYADQYGLDTFASEEVKEEVREYKVAHAPAERPQIVLEPQKVDLGNVSTKEGKVETSLTITNVGQKDLVIDSLSTSCGCTTVSVVNDGQEGPVFGTGTPSEGWSTTIQPGDTAELRIYYDPTFHQDARGPMMREIYVSSNDPVDPVVKAAIELDQVD